MYSSGLHKNLRFGMKCDFGDYNMSRESEMRFIGWEKEEKCWISEYYPIKVKTVLSLSLQYVYIYIYYHGHYGIYGCV